MMHYELVLNLRDMNQKQKVKFLNQTRERVAKDRIDPRVSDFDILVFILDYPAVIGEIAIKVLNEK